MNLNFPLSATLRVQESTNCSLVLNLTQDFFYQCSFLIRMLKNVTLLEKEKKKVHDVPSQGHSCKKNLQNPG